MSRVEVRVITRSALSRVEETEDGLRVHLNKPAVDGQANRELIRLLARHLGIARSKLSIVQGHRSKHKVIEINE